MQYLLLILNQEKDWETATATQREKILQVEGMAVEIRHIIATPD